MVVFSKHAKFLLKREFGSDLSEKGMTECVAQYEKFAISFENGMTLYFYKKSDLCSLDTATKNKVDKLREEIKVIDSSLKLLDRELSEITKSNKRLKAKLIKSLLASTDDGVAILHHISNLKDVKLLPNG